MSLCKYVAASGRMRVEVSPLPCLQNRLHRVSRWGDSTRKEAKLTSQPQHSHATAGCKQPHLELTLPGIMPDRILIDMEGDRVDLCRQLSPAGDNVDERLNLVHHTHSILNRDRQLHASVKLSLPFLPPERVNPHRAGQVGRTEV